MSRKILFWIFLLIGIGWISGVSYWYINGVENFDFTTIKWEENFTSKDPVTQSFFKGVALVIVPLLVTALLFYFIGLLFGKKNEKNLYEVKKENETLRNELAQQVDKIETMKVLYTGGKIKRMSKIKEERKDDNLNRDSDKKKESVSFEKIKKDDLKIIEGIGERIEFFLNESGIYTWEQLSLATEDRLKNILLTYGGISYKIHNPSTWSEQADLANQGKWDELNILKEKVRKGN